MWRLFYASFLVLVTFNLWLPTPQANPLQLRESALIPTTLLSVRQPRTFEPPNLSVAPDPRRRAQIIPRTDWKLTYGDNGWAFWFKSVGYFGYITNAAGVLEVFFSTVHHKALDVWEIAAQPMKAFSLEWGQLVLQFKCEIDIPWKWVAAFAQQMAEKAARGFGGTFEAMVEHIISGGIVYAKLMRKPDIAAAA